MRHRISIPLLDHRGKHAASGLTSEPLPLYPNAELGRTLFLPHRSGIEGHTTG
jgi:hypothetical protein